MGDADIERDRGLVTLFEMPLMVARTHQQPNTELEDCWQAVALLDIPYPQCPSLAVRDRYVPV
jgi:hypothetical protein